MLKSIMESFQRLELSEKFKKFVSLKNKTKILLIFALAIFILVVLFSGSISGNEEKKKDEQSLKEELSLAVFDETVYEKNIENRLASLISNVEDVGKCQVMVTLEKGEYKIFAKDSYAGTSENKDEYVILQNKNGDDTGLVLNVILPVIKGVAVVCEGGDSAVVKSEVVSIVTSVFSVNSTQVSVSKMK